VSDDRRRPNYRRLIPDLESYFQDHPVDLEAWLSSFGRFDHSLAYAALFWPEFTEVDGCVLLGSRVPETYTEWKARHSNNPSGIEAVLNHRHVFDVFLYSSEQPSRELVRHFGLLLKDMWTTKLRRDFPDREFIVSFPEDFDLEMDDPEITFYTKRDQV
jgi:hypothetical protein